MKLADCLSPLPLVAVLRGISPPEVPGVADALTGAGFRVLEVTLNSPQPFDSIRALSARCGATCLVGAGTVIDPADVARVRDAGGRLIVMPHADPAVIREAKRLGLVCIPGVATPTEAFGALSAGADALKLFPAEGLAPSALKAWRAVLPKATLVFAVGGMRPDNLAPWWEAGADGFGTGSNLYKPGAGAEAVREAARAYARGFAGLPAREAGSAP
ncbi:MAG: 2-dehydro-3-deoxy-6-phosphogalactonate aldolase [Burkholderiales bacterium]|nr:2-dehydro-3-deoxy-6-phosphogalactonate aldolase [Burkholderiales bacterium]MCE7878307.1 2-dehydro-3-deoxy-6-phosphogalactonate aldolase [Betaproteobacteria bacterium PRO3]